MKFQDATLPSTSFDPAWYEQQFGLDPDTAKLMAESAKEERVYLSSTHQVNVRNHNEYFTHASIKRIDKQPEHDWRVFQDIKNSLFGTESEAVELYPAESRLVDTANQYHLWVSRQGPLFSIGWRQGRRVSTHEEAMVVGAVQRDY